MKTYDWLVIGGGITGASLAYELQNQGWKVLLLEPISTLENATRYSYGGLPFWSGNSPETRELCQEGINLHRQLSDVLDGETEFREINLLLTIRKGESPEEVVKQYQGCEMPPQLLSVEESCELEPLLNPSAIEGTICFPHGHINPKKTNEAYLESFTRLGGEIAKETVNSFQFNQETVVGVKTNKNTYSAKNTVICAGGKTRHLGEQLGIKVPIYFTHAELLETPPLDIKLNSLIMPANDQRLSLETNATQPEKEQLWEEKEQKLAEAVIDPGAIQFCDRHLCIGQISRTISDFQPKIDEKASESWLREEIGTLLPDLKDVPGKWQHCLIAFSPQGKATIGQLENYQGIYVFSGFTSTLLFAPPLAKRFARSMSESD